MIPNLRFGKDHGQTSSGGIVFIKTAALVGYENPGVLE
jgi:hypothetical protein